MLCAFLVGAVVCRIWLLCVSSSSQVVLKPSRLQPLHLYVFLCRLIQLAAAQGNFSPAPQKLVSQALIVAPLTLHITMTLIYARCRGYCLHGGACLSGESSEWGALCVWKLCCVCLCAIV